MPSRSVLALCLLVTSFSMAYQFEIGSVPFQQTGQEIQVPYNGDVLPSYRFDRTKGAWYEDRAGVGCSSTPVTVIKTHDYKKQWDNVSKGGSQSSYVDSSSARHSQSKAQRYTSAGGGYYESGSKAKASGGSWAAYSSGQSSDWYYTRNRGTIEDSKSTHLTYYPCY